MQILCSDLEYFINDKNKIFINDWYHNMEFFEIYVVDDLACCGYFTNSFLHHSDET